MCYFFKKIKKLVAIYFLCKMRNNLSRGKILAPLDIKWSVPNCFVYQVSGYIIISPKEAVYYEIYMSVVTIDVCRNNKLFVIGLLSDSGNIVAYWYISGI